MRFIPKTVLLESEWVLRSVYGFDKVQIGGFFTSLFEKSRVYIEDREQCFEAIQIMLQGLDFADALHLASSKHVEAFITFDQQIKKVAQSFEYPEIIIP